MCLGKSILMLGILQISSHPITQINNILIFCTVLAIQLERNILSLQDYHVILDLLNKYTHYVNESYSQVCIASLNIQVYCRRIFLQLWKLSTRKLKVLHILYCCLYQNIVYKISFYNHVNFEVC